LEDRKTNKKYYGMDMSKKWHKTDGPKNAGVGATRTMKTGRQTVCGIKGIEDAVAEGGLEGEWMDHHPDDGGSTHL
jgi:hypothetical protein